MTALILFKRRFGAARLRFGLGPDAPVASDQLGTRGTRLFQVYILRQMCVVVMHALKPSHLY
ncbi:MAG TPA: hypothetical protein VIY68_20375 [Steroidobacteraceae bacterium]